MSMEIGQTLLKQLQLLLPSADRSDYHDEANNSWDISALEEDLKLQKERLQNQEEQHAQSVVSGNSSSSSTDTVSDAVSSVSDAPATAIPKNSVVISEKVDKVSHESNVENNVVVENDNGGTAISSIPIPSKEVSNQMDSLISSNDYPDSIASSSSNPLPVIPGTEPIEAMDCNPCADTIDTVETVPSVSAVKNIALQPELDPVAETITDPELQTITQSEQRKPQSVAEISESRVEIPENHRSEPVSQMPSPNASPEPDYNHNERDIDDTVDTVNGMPGLQPIPPSAQSEVQSVHPVTPVQSIAVKTTKTDRAYRAPKWTKEEDEELERLVMSHQASPMNWGSISQAAKGAIRRRTKNAMMSRWWYIKDDGKNLRVKNANKGVPKKRGRKRKAEVVKALSRGGGSPPTKRTRTSRALPGVNEWNEQALQKLYTLKRTVKHTSWFWEPVHEVKHSAKHYSLVCPQASDFGTICEKLERREYSELDTFLRSCELVFINARMFNVATHPVHAASLKVEKKFKELLDPVVRRQADLTRSKKTLKVWRKAYKTYQPFATPIDECEE